MDMMDIDLDDSYGRDEHIARPAPNPSATHMSHQAMSQQSQTYREHRKGQHIAPAAASVSSSTGGPQLPQGMSKRQQRDSLRWSREDDWVGSRPGHEGKILHLSASREDGSCYGQKPGAMPPVEGLSVPLMNLEFQSDGNVAVKPSSLKRKAGHGEPVRKKSKKDVSRDERARIDLLSFPEKLGELSDILKAMQLPSENFSMILEGVLSQSKLGLQLEVDSTIFSKIGTLCIFSGKLSINGTFIARAIGQSRRETKNEACKMAYHLLTTKSVDDLLSLTDPGVEKVKALISDLEAKGGVSAVVAALGFKDVEAKVSTIMQDTPGNVSDSREALYMKLYSNLELVIHMLKTAMEEKRFPSAMSLGKVVYDAKIGVQVDYTCQTTLENKYRGDVRIGRVLVASLDGDDSIKLKPKVFELAVQNLLNTSVDVLLQRCPGIHALKSVKEPQKKKLPCTLPADVQAILALDYKFYALMQRIRASEYELSSVVLITDGYTIQCLLTPTLYYSYADRGDDGEVRLLCELYMSDVFISSAVDTDFKASMCAAYTKAWSIFKTGSVDEILKGSRMTEEMKYDKKYVEIYQKGKKEFTWSNKMLLESMHPDGANLGRPLSDLVILETEEWAKEGAFSVLNNSTAKCGLVMEWTFIKEAHSNSKCSVSIQKQMFAVSRHSQRYKAREESSLRTFRQLCETNDVIQEHPKNYSQNWFTWEEIQEDAAQAEDIPTVDVNDNDESELIIKHEKEVSYVCYIIEKYFNDESNHLMDWVSDPHMPLAEQQFIMHHVTQFLGLEAKQKTHIDGSLFLVVSKCISLPTIVAMLKQSETKSVGKYSLLNLDGKMLQTMSSMVLNGPVVQLQNMTETSTSMTCPKLCDQLLECSSSASDDHNEKHKGALVGIAWTSNVQQLISMFPDYNADDLNRPISDLILMEPEYGAKGRSSAMMFTNVRSSATKSRICVDWSLEKTGHIFECNVFLQKEPFASGKGNKILECRQEAFAYATARLYKTSTVIQLLPDLSTQLNWDELVVEAKDWEPEAIDEVALTYDDSTETLNHPVEIMYLCSVMRYYFEKSNAQKYLDLEIFGLPTKVADIAKKYAEAELSCKHRKRRVGTDFQHIFYLEPSSLPELLKVLEASEAGRVGKYRLVTREELQRRLDDNDVPEIPPDTDVTPDVSAATDVTPDTTATKKLNVIEID